MITCANKRSKSLTANLANKSHETSRTQPDSIESNQPNLTEKQNKVISVNYGNQITERRSSNGSDTSDSNNDNYEECKAKYKDELNKAMQPNLKGADYAEVFYIKGPFTPYGLLKMKSKLGETAAKREPDVSKWHLDNLILACAGSKDVQDKKVSWFHLVNARDIPRDQLRPHKLRKDRQIKNPYRKIHVQNKIRKIGGFIKDRSTGEFHRVVSQ